MKIDESDIDKFLRFMVDRKEPKEVQTIDYDLRQFMGHDNPDYNQGIMGVLEQEKPLWFEIRRQFGYGWIAILNRNKEQEIRDFLKDGGFERIERNKTERETAKADLENTKLNQDIELNRWLIKTKWLPHLFSTIALALSLYTLYKSTNSVQREEMPQLQQQARQAKVPMPQSAPYIRQDSLLKKDTAR